MRPHWEPFPKNHVSYRPCLEHRCWGAVGRMSAASLIIWPFAPSMYQSCLVDANPQPRQLPYSFLLLETFNINSERRVLT